MKNKCLYARKRVSGIMVFLLCSAVVFMAGCEPLRKKFTRKKRMSQVKGIDPILDPVDYPDYAGAVCEQVISGAARLGVLAFR